MLHGRLCGCNRIVLDTNGLTTSDDLVGMLGDRKKRAGVFCLRAFYALICHALCR